MSASDQTEILDLAGGELPDRLWTADDLPPGPDRPVAEPAAGVITLGYLRAAVRRARLFLAAMAALGLVVGLALMVLAPPAYQAKSTLMLAHPAGEDAVSAQATDAVLAGSDAVALRAMRQLGVASTPAKFESSYTVSIVTNQILDIVFRAASPDTAVRDLNAVTSVFLKFRASQMLAAQKGVLASLDQQIARGASHVTQLARQLTRLRQQPSTDATAAQIAQLRAQHTAAVSAQQVLVQSVRGNQASTQIGTTTVIQGSTVLNRATPVPHSRIKLPAEYLLGGLLGGLVLGLVIVIVRTLVSDRLRRRDDVARLLGAPVRLSIRGAGPRRWLPGPRGLAAARSGDLRRVLTFLDGAVAVPDGGGSGTLALAPAGEPAVAALCLAALAVQRAQQGQRVILADLSLRASAGRLLGATAPGVSKVTADGAELAVMIPDRDDVLPAGPLGASRPGGPDGPGGPARPAADELRAAYKSADLLLTLAELDPAAGAGYLGSWTGAVVAVVTAGQSSATRVQALGEMVRLAGLPLEAVLIAADGTDESLGVPPPAPEPGTPGGEAGLQAEFR